MMRILEDTQSQRSPYLALPESAAGFLPETRRDKKSTSLAGSNKEQTRKTQAVGAILALTEAGEEGREGWRREEAQHCYAHLLCS